MSLETGSNSPMSHSSLVIEPGCKLKSPESVFLSQRGLLQVLSGRIAFLCY